MAAEEISIKKNHTSLLDVDRSSSWEYYCASHILPCLSLDVRSVRHRPGARVDSTPRRRRVTRAPTKEMIVRTGRVHPALTGENPIQETIRLLGWTQSAVTCRSRRCVESEKIQRRNDASVDDDRCLFEMSLVHSAEEHVDVVVGDGIPGTFDRRRRW